MVLLVVSRELVRRVARRELLRLEVVRVAHGRADTLRGPLRATDRLVDVRLRDGRVHEARGGRVGGVEIARPDAGDGSSREPGVHRSSALAGRLPVRGDAGEYREDEREHPGDREPERVSQTRALLSAAKRLRTG